MEHWRLLFVLFALCVSVFAQIPQGAGDEATHNALRAMRDAVVAAVNKGDMEALIPHLHKNIVFTAMSGEVCRGHDALRTYFNRMMKDPGHIVASLSINPTVDRLTDLYGDTGVAYGSSVDRYKLTDGQEFDVNARWSVTMVKENGEWQIASFQSAANVFDNPLLNKAKSALYWVAAGAGLAGVVLGALIGRRSRKSAA
jgi:ketosteroid isomerase-like protein